MMLRLQKEGAHNINFVSPSHMVFQMADAIEEARRLGLAIPIVYNSNGYDSLESLRRIRGLVDIFLPDLKYMGDTLGRCYSGVDDYADIAPAAIEEMLGQVGPLELDPEGIARRGLLVRHLVLPGRMENSRDCLSYLAGLGSRMAISVMSQYSPQHNAALHPGMDRVLSPEEYDEVVDCALELGLKNAFVQELESQLHYLPDFERERPFDPTRPRPAPAAPFKPGAHG
jgi:putative pyruvate formate lyase activating enzyme